MLLVQAKNMSKPDSARVSVCAVSTNLLRSRRIEIRWDLRTRGAREGARPHTHRHLLLGTQLVAMPAQVAAATPPVATDLVVFEC